MGELHIFGKPARNQTETPYDRSRKFLLDGGRKPLEGRRHFVRRGESFQAFRQSCEIPQQYARLPSIGIATALIEISGGEFGIIGGQEPPRPVIETFAGDVDVVAV